MATLDEKLRAGQATALKDGEGHVEARSYTSSADVADDADRRRRGRIATSSQDEEGTLGSPGDEETGGAIFGNEEKRHAHAHGAQELGKEKYHKLSWQALFICLLVEAVALGTLSFPRAFAVLGLVPGILITFLMGLIAIYTGKVVGDACLAHPEVNHWSGLGRLVAGRIGEEYVGASFVLVLILLVGGHVLTGAQALSTISEDITCRIVWAVVSAVVLFLLALPKSFHQISFLGYIDFVSLIAAVLVTIIATGIAAGNRAGGVSSVEWHAFPVDNPSFTQATVQVLNIAFGFSFNIVLPSAMPELVHREHYIRSVVALGAFEIVFYTLVGSLIYVFVGQDVQSPALLSAGPTMARIAFGLALPLIYISGSINGTATGLYIYRRIFKPSSPHRYIGTRFGNIIWVLLILGITVLAFVIAEAVPIFSDLLGLISSLFVSGFSFYLPALVWAFAGRDQRTEPWHSWRNLLWGTVNLAIFAIGLFLLGAGTASSVISIRDSYRDGTAKTPFTCSS